MRYVPDLISDSAKVLPDYFKGAIYHAAKKNKVRDNVLWVIGVFFFIGALVSIKHPVMTVIFGLIGFILIPPGHRYIERKLKFRLTTKIKTIATAALFIFSLPLTGYYANIDEKAAYEQKLADEKTAKEKAIADQKEQQRKDSLAYYIEKGNRFANQHKLEEANRQLYYAKAFALLPADNAQIEKEKISIATIKTFALVKAGKYRAALPEINNLLRTDPSNAELLYNRAVCYSKTGNLQDAVNDLKPLLQAGNANAEKLHDKINPIRRRIIDHETLCCDGTTSSATGRGACSHHGGVCDWNHPVYEESRKYE